jgi:hypothetical protein
MGIAFAAHAGDGGALHIVARHSGEIFGDGIKRVGGQFGEYAAQAVLNVVNEVEKAATVDFKFTAAEFPVAAEQEVVAEDLALQILKGPAADEAEISHKFFPFSRISAVAGGPAAPVPGYRIGVRSEGNALSKTAIASSKNSPKYAIARRFSAPENGAHAIAMAEVTRGLRKADYVGSLPLHCMSFSFGGPA